MGRSVKKGPFIVVRIFERIQQSDQQLKKSGIKTWARSMTILPCMVGHTFAVYNGERHLPVFISDQMVGHKLGEFSPTRKFRSHLRKDKKRKKRIT